MLRKQRTAAPDDEPIGILIAAARSAINQAARARLEGSQLTPQQFWVLMALFEHPGTSLREVCEQRRMDPPTGSRVVAALARRKLVHVGGDAADRMRCCLELTPLGRTLARSLRGVLRDLRQRVVHGLSPAEQRTFRTLLRRVVANVTAPDTPQPVHPGPSHDPSLEP